MCVCVDEQWWKTEEENDEGHFSPHCRGTTEGLRREKWDNYELKDYYFTSYNNLNFILPSSWIKIIIKKITAGIYTWLGKYHVIKLSLIEEQRKKGG